MAISSTGARGLLSALMLASLSTQASAEVGACLTDGEARSLVLYALPDVANILGQSCAASLPATAYIVRSRETLFARYDKAAAPAAPAARQAFFKMTGLKSDAFAKMDDRTIRDLIGMGVTSAMGKGIKAGDCRIINDVLEQLDPLPPENVAALIGVALREGGNKSDKPGSNPFRLCGAQQGL